MASQPNSLAYKTLWGIAILTAAMALIAVGGQNWGLAIWGGVLAGGLMLGTRLLKSKVTPINCLSTPYRTSTPAPAEEGVTRVHFAPTGEDDHETTDETEEVEATELDVNEPIEALFDWLEAFSGQWPDDALTQVKALAATVTDFTETDADGDFAFDTAALHDAPVDVLTFLLSTRSKPEADDELLSRVLDNDPALATVQFLLDNGFDPNGPSQSYESLLEQTIEDELDDALSLALLRAGAHPTGTTTQGQDILAYVVQSTASHAVLELMLEQGYSPNPGEDHPLMLAVANEDGLAVAMLLHHGANPFARDENDQTPLQAILEDGADPAALARLVCALDNNRQQRALGWIEAVSGDDEIVSAVEEHLIGVANLQKAWTTGSGFGDPMQARARTPNPVQDTLDATLIQHVDDILKVQNLILLGANPLATPRGQPSALDAALTNEDPLIVATLLECLTDAEAQVWLDNVDDNASYAVALRLRRAQRARWIAKTFPTLAQAAPLDALT